MFTLAGDLSTLFLAAMMMGNHANCSQFAASNRLDWLVDRLEESQQSSTGTPPLTLSRSFLHHNTAGSPGSTGMDHVYKHKYFSYAQSVIFVSISSD